MTVAVRRRAGRPPATHHREEQMLRNSASAGIGLVSALLAGLFSTTALAQAKVVRFLHNETDPPSIEFFNAAIKEFEAANPDVKIEMEAISTDGRLQKGLASINTKSMPEVFRSEERRVGKECRSRWS